MQGKNSDGGNENRKTYGRHKMRQSLFFIPPTIAIILGHFLVINESIEKINIATTPFLFLSLFIIGAGYFIKEKTKHVMLCYGWMLFAIYWATQPEILYYKGEGDIVNALFCIAGVYFLSYISYHEWLSYKKEENLASLNFLAGATFVAGLLYFIFEKVDFLAGLLIKIVAEQTASIMNFFGYNVTTGNVIYGINTVVPIYFNGHESVQLILACTGLQSMAVFVGVFGAVNSDYIKRIKGLLITVITIYILNLIRNAGVIYGMEILGIDFYIMHNVIGKIGSLIALIVLAFITFEMVPEIYNNISALFDLTKRK
ncbi:MAG: archaeosortase A [Thermoplasmatales archaeon]|nr:archaeosortase A [Thermoplasmatales archaeon]